MEVSIFSFSDYRSFIRAWLKKAKASKMASLTSLAAVTQIHVTYLSQVISGKRDLNLEQASLISEHLKLTSLEKDYLFTLIQLERAGNRTLRTYFEERKDELLKQKDNMAKRLDHYTQISDEEKALFYSNWLYAAVTVATAIENGQTLEQISERFGLSREKSQNILSFLCKIGLCVFDNNLYRLGQNHIHLPASSPFINKHHTNWRLQALEEMNALNSQNLFFTSPMSVSKRDFELIRERCQQLLADMIKIAKDSRAEQVICLNLDLFLR